MYEAYYGLRDKPFQLNPDPAFYFGSRQHRRAMSYLEYGLHQNEGFIVITGEIGAGKTTLVRNLFAKLDQSKLVAAHMVSTQLDPDNLIRMVAAAFGVPTKGLQKSDILLALEAYFVSVAHEGKRCLLVVDEAQNLTPGAVEELRMLSNFQLETHALLQSFLVGQPEFRATLHSPELEQLRQRVIAASHIGAMSPAETQAYIEHRLMCVDWSGVPHFEPAAYLAVHDSSGGIPRRINAVCDRLLWYGYLADKKSFTAQDVLEVAEEMRDEARSGKAAGNAQSPFSSDSANTHGRLQVVSTTQSSSSSRRGGPSLSGASESPKPLEEELDLIKSELQAIESTLARLERYSLDSTMLFGRLVSILDTGKGKSARD